MVCDKKDSEQPAVSADVLNNKIIIQDEIESKDLEFVDCDGKLTKTEHGPERDLNKFALIEAPGGLPEAVSSVAIENYRTCAVHEFDAQNSAIGGKKSKLAEVITPPVASSAVDHSGRMIVQLSDSANKFNFYLNVHEGLNVLKVKYFGKCQKQKEKKVSPEKDDSFVNCEVSKEIGSKDVVLEVHIRRPEVSGKKQIKVCDKE